MMLQVYLSLAYLITLYNTCFSYFMNYRLVEKSFLSSGFIYHCHQRYNGRRPSNKGTSKQTLSVLNHEGTHVTGGKTSTAMKDFTFNIKPVCLNVFVFFNLLQLFVLTFKNNVTGMYRNSIKHC